MRKAASEMLDYNGCGMSVMEMSHRGSIYLEIINSAEESLRHLMNIPDNYRVLFLQGGASTQFAMVPINLMVKNRKADYVLTGMWSNKAFEEGKKFGDAVAVASSEDQNFSYIPDLNEGMFRKDADYVHITVNNTIFGTRFLKIPDVGDLTLVGDASSNILAEPINVSEFGLIYAGAQKNLGASGVTVVIVRDDLVGNCSKNVPTMLNYKTHVEGCSMYNTPPTYSIYICKLVFDHILSLGGVPAMYETNLKKSGILYDYLENSKMFSATAREDSRSIVNIPFVTKDKEIDKKFIKSAEKRGLVSLAGHRSIGGMRASMYNGMPVEGAKALVDFMHEFEKDNS